MVSGSGWDHPPPQDLIPSSLGGQAMQVEDTVTFYTDVVCGRIAYQ